MNINPFAVPVAADFSGPAQQMLFRRYGDPRHEDWERRWMEDWHVQKDFSWFPAAHIYIHKEFKQRLHDAFTELEQKGLHAEIRSFDGAFSLRTVRGSDTALSVHSWGAAIDMNAAENPVGTAGSWSCPFLEVMLLNGIFCGQNWVGRKDPMHFAMVNG